MAEPRKLRLRILFGPEVAIGPGKVALLRAIREAGSISAGARADIVVLDPEHPSLVGRVGDEVLDSWIFSGEDTPVRDVIAGGAWVVRDGRHDRGEEVATRYRVVADRLRS